MALVPALLATEMKNGLGFSTLLSTSQLDSFAAAIIDHIKTGVVSNAPNTVNGSAPPSGGPLIGGTAINGTIALVSTDLEQRIVAAIGNPSPQVIQMAVAISSHFVTFSNISFALITGNCTNTPTTPGVLIGEGINGTIAGLNQNLLASAISSGIGQPNPSPELLTMCQNIITYIQLNASVTYPPASVTAIVSAGGGPIINGSATGGFVS